MKAAVYVLLLPMVIPRQALCSHVDAICTSGFNGAAVKELHHLRDA